MKPANNILHTINSPADLKALSVEELESLAREIRQEIISVVSKNGGHLGGSLGAVELIIALHYVFDSPKDKIVFDVGHQAYSHKLLTGRRDAFSTLRLFKGLSGFCKPSESEHDVFGTGHTSNSISAALGLAAARDLAKENYDVVAVIGDGAYAAGMAFEALNHLGGTKQKMIVILNDNGMSISESVGAISESLKMGSGFSTPFHLRAKAKSFLERMQGFSKPQSEPQSSDQAHPAISLSMVAANSIRYLGPVDGHNINELIAGLRKVKAVDGPVVFHVKTKKGMGYSYAEQDVDKLHGTGPFDPENGKKHSSGDSTTFTEAFSGALMRLGEQDKKIVAVTAAMGSGTGLKKFGEKFPGRMIDAGICEQHAVTFSAGLAINGMKPVCAIYSTFLQRGYDQIITDACLQNLSIVFAIDRSGLVGDDGPTHHGPFDIAFLRALPNMTIMVPKDGTELADMLFTALSHQGPVAIRYPRASCISYEEKEFSLVETGKAETVRKGDELLVLCLGPVINDAVEAVEELGVDATIINARFAKPLDKKMILDSAKAIGKVMTIEESSLPGGFGSAVLELFNDNHLDCKVMRLGIPDSFIEQAPRKLQLKISGLDKESIKEKILELLSD